MRTWLTPLRMKFMQTCPHTYIRLSKFVSRYMFPATTRLLKGDLRSQLDRTSVVYFGHNRCATRVTHRVFEALCRDEGRPVIDLETYFARTDGSKMALVEDPEFLGRHFHPEGFYYGPHYRYRPIPGLERFKVFLMLRDPRDVITSRYYSQGFAHTLMDEAGLKRRQEVQAMTVDEFVRERAHEVRQYYQAYIDNLYGKPYVLYISYEEMIADFPKFLDRVIAHFGLRPSRAAVERAIEAADFKVTKEDIYSHKRSVKPGSHLRKLQPETVRFVNEAYREVLAALGYKPTTPEEAGG